MIDRKKQFDLSFSCVCPVIDNEFHDHIVKAVCKCTQLLPHGLADYFDRLDNVMMKLNNRTDAQKTDVNLLTIP